MIDPLGGGLATLSAVLVTASLVFSWRYFDQIVVLYPTLMLTFLGAMCGFCLTGDLFNLFVFFELMSVAAYALTAYKIEVRTRIDGRVQFCGDQQHRRVLRARCHWAVVRTHRVR